MSRPSPMWRRRFRALFGATSLVLPCAVAFAAEPAVPSAGSLLQQIPPAAAPRPAAGAPLTIERQAGGPAAASAPFSIQGLRISGNTVFDTSTLHALVADAEGRSLTLAELEAIAARITAHYVARGFLLSRAIIPAQTITAGVVRIEVIEARFDRIVVDNRSRVSDPLLAATLAGLQGGQLIEAALLDRALLLLSDIPGVLPAATLTPGRAIGTAELLVDVEPGPAATASVLVDSFGSQYTGRVRIGASGYLVNPFHRGDLLGLSALSSGKGLSHGRIDYETLLNGHGTRLGGAYSALRYELGGSLGGLEAHGSAVVTSLWSMQPIVRGRHASLYGQLRYEHLQLRDRIDAAGIRNDRHVSNWIAGLSGDLRDDLGSGGRNTWSVSLASGQVGFDDAAARSADAATAGTQGSFSMANAAFTRLQSLGPRSTLYVSLAGQWASANLDASRKMAAGGPHSVRAYDVGAVSGDSGHAETIELRHELDLPWPGRWQAAVFADRAYVRINKSPWAAVINDATLSGAGVSLHWAGPRLSSARLVVATRVGTLPALLAGAATTRAWIEVGQRF